MALNHINDIINSSMIFNNNTRTMIIKNKINKILNPIPEIVTPEDIVMNALILEEYQNYKKEKNNDIKSMT